MTLWLFAGLAVVMLVAAVVCRLTPSVGGTMPADLPRPGEHVTGVRSWHGNLYVDDATGRVVGKVQPKHENGVWYAVRPDGADEYISEASARRAIEEAA